MKTRAVHALSIVKNDQVNGVATVVNRCQTRKLVALDKKLQARNNFLVSPAGYHKIFLIRNK